MAFKELYATFISGAKIKRKSWDGYWQYGHGKIKIHCKDGKVIDLLDTKDVLFTVSNILQDDWEVIE